MLVENVLEGDGSVSPGPRGVEKYPTPGGGEEELAAVPLGPKGPKLLVAYPESVGDGRPDDASKAEGEPDEGAELPLLPVTGEVEETSLEPLAVGRSDGPTTPLLGSPIGYDDEPFEDAVVCSVPGDP